MATAFSAQAQNCGPHDRLVKSLAANYQEKTAAIGITNTGSLIEVLVSDKGTWTIIVTSPEGHSCIVSAGDDWREAVDETF